MRKHTPGPWKLDDQIDTVTILGADDSPVCVVEVGEGPDEGFAAEADISLIVSAPDLLAALKAAQRRLCEDSCPTKWKAHEPMPHCPECAAARAAIAAARGGGR